MRHAELVPLSDLRDFPENPKEGLGAAYDTALKTSIEKFGFKGAMVLTPRVNRGEAPELADLYGDDGKYMVADGNKRLERLGDLGFQSVLVLPGLDSATGGLDMAGMLASVGVLKSYEARTQAGEKVALAVSYPDLNSPKQVKLFVLGYDRARARFDEGQVQTTIEEMIAIGEDPDLLRRLSAQNQASIRDILKRDEREQAEAEEAARRAGLTGPEKIAEKKKEKEAALRFPHYLSFTVDGEKLYQEMLGEVKASIQPGPDGRFLAILEKARKYDVEEDVLSEIALERAWAVILREREERHKGAA